MKFVYPIKNIDRINEIKKLLDQQQSKRDYVFFVLGINTGLRLNDLLNLKVLHVFDGKQIRDFIHVRSCDPPYFINNNSKKALNKYLNQGDFDLEDFLFKSKKSNLPITRQQAYRIIKNAGKEVGLTDNNIGTHTLRKTFGYHAYKKGVAISLLQKIFHHASSNETLHYLDIKSDSDILIKIDVNL